MLKKVPGFVSKGQHRKCATSRRQPCGQGGPRFQEAPGTQRPGEAAGYSEPDPARPPGGERPAEPPAEPRRPAPKAAGGSTITFFFPSASSAGRTPPATPLGFPLGRGAPAKSAGAARTRRAPTPETGLGTWGARGCHALVSPPSKWSPVCPARRRAAFPTRVPNARPLHGRLFPKAQLGPPLLSPALPPSVPASRALGSRPGGAGLGPWGPATPSPGRSLRFAPPRTIPRAQEPPLARPRPRGAAALKARVTGTDKRRPPNRGTHSGTVPACCRFRTCPRSPLLPSPTPPPASRLAGARARGLGGGAEPPGPSGTRCFRSCRKKARKRLGLFRSRRFRGPREAGARLPKGRRGRAGRLLRFCRT